jgi:hypothetical protein
MQSNAAQVKVIHKVVHQFVRGEPGNSTIVKNIEEFGHYFDALG